MATHGYVSHVVPHSQCLPKPLESGKPTTLTVPGSDVPPAVKGAVRLRIQLESESAVAVQLNGHPVDLERAPELEQRFGMVWLTGPVPQEALRKGENRVAVRLPDAGATVRLTGVEVLVQYSGTK